MRNMPVPNLTEPDLLPLEKAIADYPTAVQSVVPGFKQSLRKGSKVSESLKQKQLFSENARRSPKDGSSADDLKILHWRIDARSYDFTTCRRLWNVRCSTFSRAFAGGVCRSTNRVFSERFYRPGTVAGSPGHHGGLDKTNRRLGEIA